MFISFNGLPNIMGKFFKPAQTYLAIVQNVNDIKNIKYGENLNLNK